MNHQRKHASRCRQGFTLVEIVVVVAIMALLIALAGSMFAPGLNAQKLATTARTLAGDLKLAALRAAKEGRLIEVRFYHYAPTDAPGGSFFRAYQFAMLTGFAADAKPHYRLLGEVKHFPPGIVLAPGAEYTTLESLPKREKAEGDPEFAPDYSIAAYQINPAGSTTLPRIPTPVLTIVEERFAGETLPANYWSITIDSDNNSHTEIY